MNYLLDTNIISELVKPNPSKLVLQWFNGKPNDTLHISVLTLGEIRKGIEKLSNNKQKEKLLLWLEQELPTWFEERILPIDHQVADKWGHLQAQVKNTPAAIDSLLAATAIYHDLYLVTRNEKDFHFPLLQVINPFHKQH